MKNLITQLMIPFVIAGCAHKNLINIETLENKVQIDPGTSKIYKLSPEEVNIYLPLLARTAEWEDSWVYNPNDSTLTDVGIPVDRNSLNNNDEIIKNIKEKNHDQSIKYIHIHNSLDYETSQKIYYWPPAHDDFKISLPNEILSGIQTEVVDGNGTWTYKWDRYPIDNSDKDYKLDHYKILRSNFLNAYQNIPNFDFKKEYNKLMQGAKSLGISLTYIHAPFLPLTRNN